MSSSDVDPSVLSALTEKVASQHAEDTAARAEALEAAAASLEAIVTRVRPALPALARKVKVKASWTSGQNGCNPVDRKTFHA